RDREHGAGVALGRPRHDDPAVGLDRQTAVVGIETPSEVDGLSAGVVIERGVQRAVGVEPAEPNVVAGLVAVLGADVEVPRQDYLFGVVGLWLQGNAPRGEVWHGDPGDTVGAERVVRTAVGIEPYHLAPGARVALHDDLVVSLHRHVAEVTPTGRARHHA